MTNRTGSGGTGRRRARLIVGAGFLLVVFVVSSMPQRTTALAQANTGLDVLGLLPLGEFGEDLHAPKVIGIDHERRRLYAAIAPPSQPPRIAEFDLAAGDIPALIRVSEPFLPTTTNTSPAAVMIDSKTRRAVFLTKPQAGQGAQSLIFVDLETLTQSASWNLTEKAPGFVPRGVTYNPERDRFYLVGVFDGDANVSLVYNILGTNSPTAAVIALDGQTGSLVWADALSGCDSPLLSQQSGSVIGLSEQRPVLYTFCSSGVTLYQPTGQGGLVRLDLTDEGQATGLADFPMQFFPVSGDYSGTATKSGATGFDPVRERFFAQSLSSRTHGAWVFDGLRSSWVGFIASPDDWNVFVGIDESTGKHFMAGGDVLDTATGTRAYINVTSGGATPVPQGQVFDPLLLKLPSGEEKAIAPWSDLVVDPLTNRVFLGARWDNPDKPPKFEGEIVIPYDYGLVALRDNTQPLSALTAPDLDALTNDLGDAEAHLEYSSNTSGFGAQYAAVGGWENAYSRVTVPFFTLLNEFKPANPANLQYGTRGATVAKVDSIGIAPAGSSASAIASQPDDSSQKDGAGQTQQVAPDDETLEFSPATCLDGIGEKATVAEGSPEQPTYAVVTCDLKGLETVAHTHFSDQTGAGGVGVSSASFDGRTYRDPKRGVVSETTAVAEGIVFGDVEVGGVAIDRVITTATTAANGLDGTSYARWERVVESARTIDALGFVSEAQSCRTVIESGKDPVHEGDCAGIEQQANEVVKNRFRMRLPLPELIASPGGAFASVQETETDYLNGLSTNDDILRAISGLEVTVFNDGPEKGRLIVQMAAIRSDSTFIRSPKPVITPFEIPTPDPGSPTEAPQTPIDQPPPDDGVTAPLPISAGGEQPRADDAPPMVAISHEERLVGAFGWLPAVRNLSQGLLVGALYLLFAVPIAESVRRRRLLHVLMDDTTPTTQPRSSS